jgi:hypothetical protein
MGFSSALLVTSLAIRIKKSMVAEIELNFFIL